MLQLLGFRWRRFRPRGMSSLWEGTAGLSIVRFLRAKRAGVVSRRTFQKLKRSGESGRNCAIINVQSSMPGGGNVVRALLRADRETATCNQAAARRTGSWTLDECFRDCVQDCDECQATGEYGEGFAREVDLIGAYYNKTKSLNDCYEALKSSVGQPALNGVEPKGESVLLLIWRNTRAAALNFPHFIFSAFLILYSL